MSPLPQIAAKLSGRAFQPGAASSQFSTQWQNPSDVFSVLLILGGDVIQAALAQLAGSSITPIAFSFGWVAYGVSAIVSAVGDNKLMPMADCSCKVINGKSGFARDNVSWIIGRIVRDFETWMDDCKPDGPIRTHLEGMLNLRWDMNKERAEVERQKSGKPVPEPERPIQTGLCVSVYKAEQAKPGYTGKDFPYYIGFVTVFIQLGIAAIPCGLYGDYGQLLITAAGTLLAFANGSLPQWAKEKWTARTNTKQSFILTRGNGSQHAIVIIGDGKGMDLEDLSAVPTNVDVWTSTKTKWITIALGILWICLLISASGLSEHTWFLMAIGGIGILENIYVAGRWRTPEAFGIPLRFIEVIGEIKTMDTLFAVEEKYPYLGAAMLDTFFPGELFPAEQDRWDRFKESAKARKKALEESVGEG